MLSSASADLVPLVSRSAFHDEVASALRLFIGRGRRYTVKQVSKATGVKDRVIECAMALDAQDEARTIAPHLLMSIAAFLGPDFTTEWLAIAHQGAFALPDGDAPPPGVLAADASEDSATLARYAVEDEPAPARRQGLGVVGTRMVGRGQQLVKLAQAA